MAFVQMITMLIVFHYTSGEYCYKEMPCYPSNGDISTFNGTLQGNVYEKGESMYNKIVIMKNTRVTKYPDLILVVMSTADVQKGVQFARQHNLRIVVQSSGHDFQGRSTADDSFMIYLGEMTNIEVKKGKTDRAAAGEIVLESGNQWVNVYKEVDKHDRVVVGCNAHTVAIGGYTLGGGHSPISGVGGLSVDNLLEIEMVTGDGSIVIADNTSTTTTYQNGRTVASTDNDIFWASCGGGGGTYGIVTKFTFKMHFPPTGMVRFSCEYPIIHENINVGKQILRAYADLIPNMPPEWGGYLIIWATSKFLSNHIYHDGSVGSIAIYMNHFGDYNSSSRSYMDTMMNYNGLARHCSYENLSTFWEYERNVRDTIYQRNAIIGTLMQANRFSDAWIDFVIDFVLRAYREGWNVTMYFTGILLGGKVMEVNPEATSVHPGWRTAVLSATMGIEWGNNEGDIHDNYAVNLINSYQSSLYAFGNGMYPNEAGSNVSSFSTHFWGSNYPRLLQIKKEWDPENIFTCLECVVYTASASTFCRAHFLTVYFSVFFTMNIFLGE